MKDTLLSVISLLLIFAIPGGLLFFQSGANLSQAIGLSLLSIIAGLFTSFFTKVWETLNQRWAVKFADWFGGVVEGAFSGYEKKYKQHIYFRHRDFDVKGLTTQNVYTLELEQVFVDLRVVPATVHDVPTNPVYKFSEKLQSGKHSVWEYLEGQRKDGGQRLAIIGPPGSGKSTLLKHIALVLCGSSRQRKQANAPDCLPVLLFLREIAEQLSGGNELLLPETIQTTLRKWDREAPPHWFENKLKDGKCLVMFDGLDEVADRTLRRKVVTWIEQQMAIYSQCDYIVTSRPFGYKENSVSGVNVLQVMPFSMEQVRRFIKNWYLANEIKSSQQDDQGIRMRAQEEADDLIQRLEKTPVLLELAVNPLLLTMVATVHRYRSSLPGRRVELYKEICEVFLGKRQAARGLQTDLTPAQKQTVLQPLAYEMMQRKKREINREATIQLIEYTLRSVTQKFSPEEFLEDVENSSGLLIEWESGVYSFSHLTIQEYLAAVHIIEKRLETDLVRHVEDSWWRETIRLYVAQADATPIIEACLANDPPSAAAISLAMDCAEEARQLAQETRQKLEQAITKGLESV